MKIDRWRLTDDLNAAYREIRNFDLESNLAELHAFGFTVIEGALSAQLTRRLREAILRVAEERLGRKLDLENEKAVDGWRTLSYLLQENRVFEELVLSEKALAFATYMVGPKCILNSVASIVKGPDGEEIPLHSDNGPVQMTDICNFLNVNYALVDYAKERGALAMVPGSHQLRRQPQPGEMSLSGPGRNKDAIPVEVPAGSAIIWHGNTWHGSFPRTLPGLRVQVATTFVRDFMQTWEDFSGVRDDIVGRHGIDSRLACLIGAHSRFPDKRLVQSPGNRRGMAAEILEETTT